MSQTEISVVIPLYKCSNSILELYSRLTSSLRKIVKDYEIIFVDDRSPENDWEIVKNITIKDDHVVGVRLSRNFGQHQAITAGLDQTKGNWVVVMDGDLQDQPEEIEKLYKTALEGFDFVLGKRVKRQDPFFKKMTSRLFYCVYNYMTKQNSNSEIANFGIYSRKVIDAILCMPEKNRSFAILILWTGFKKKEIEIAHAKRSEGISSYSFRARLQFALNIILSHSIFPLIITVQAGAIISACSFLYALYLVISYMITPVPVSGWTSMMTLIALMSGIIIAVIGVVGLYVGKIYEEVKGRPLFIIDEVVSKSMTSSNK